MTSANLDAKANAGKVELTAGYELGGTVGSHTKITQQLDGHGVGSSVNQTSHIGNLSSNQTEFSAINGNGYQTGSSQAFNVGGTTVYGTSNELNITKDGINMTGETTVMGETLRINLDSKDATRGIKNAAETVANGISKGVNEGGEKIVAAANEVAENIGEAVTQVTNVAGKLSDAASNVGDGIHKFAGMINFGGVIQGASTAAKAIGRVGGHVINTAPHIIDGASKAAHVVGKVGNEVVKHAPEVAEVALEIAGAFAKI